MADVGRCAVGNSGAQLDKHRGRDQLLLDHLLYEPKIAGVEYFQFGLDPKLAQDLGTTAQVIRGRDIGAVAVAEIQAAAIERGNFRPVEAFAAQLDDVSHALFLAAEVTTRRRRVLQPALADADITAHAAGQIDNHIHLALAYALDDFAVMARLHAERAGVGFTHVDVDDGRAGPCRLHRRARDLFRSDRAVRALGHVGVVAGDCAGDEHVVVHDSPYWIPQVVNI